jgi:hypothetical protein
MQLVSEKKSGVVSNTVSRRNLTDPLETIQPVQNFLRKGFNTCQWSFLW